MKRYHVNLLLSKNTMAPQQITVGGNKNGGGGLFYLAGALGTAFAVDYWLTNNKMEEELSRESDSFSEEKAENLMKSSGIQTEQHSEDQTPAELSREASKTEEELVEELKHQIQVTEPLEVEEVAKCDNLDFSEGELEQFIETEEEVEEDLSAGLSTSLDLPFALWKLILLAVLAFAWTMGGNTQERVPTLQEEYAETKINTFPMLGFEDSKTSTAVAVAVDELDGKSKDKSEDMTKNSTALTLPKDDEEKWMVIPFIVLAMMIL